VRRALLHAGAATGAAEVRSRLRHSIGTKIFVAFFAMGVIIGALGAYGYRVLSSAGDMVTGTYDGPLMAINYARAASVDFVQMQQAMLRRKIADRADRPKYDKQIDNLTDTFFADLDVAGERSGAKSETAIVANIRGLVQEWQTRWRVSERSGRNPDLEALDAEIMDRFDMLVELNADHSFIGRRKAVWAIGYYKYALTGGTVGALLLAFFITFFLARRIMRPLSEAVSVADRIALGEFETRIPTTGADETGVLLNSMTIMQDNIREMMAREQERAESAEGRLVHAIETSGEGVLLVDREGRILIANNIMRNFFPSVADLLVPGASFDSISLLAQQDFSERTLLPTSRDLLKGGGARILGSAERQLKDGRWIRSTGSRAEDGALMFFVSDYTAVKEREENARRAREAAEAASAAKSRFLANMSHELRTPLNAIIGFSEILTNQIFGVLGSARYLEYATDIQRSGRHLLDIINSVLEISKSEAGKQSLESEPVDVRYILRDCVKMLSESSLAGTVDLHLEEGSLPAMVPGEKAKLRQAFLNLISNAAKFTSPGGHARVTVGSTGANIFVKIVDTGIGMTAEHIEIALTPFGQVDSRLERKYEGTGLGLPLAKSLIELHGGRLDIESAPGKGTVAMVYLPKCDEPQRQLAEAS